jgi:hypothetical protein
MNRYCALQDSETRRQVVAGLPVRHTTLGSACRSVFRRYEASHSRAQKLTMAFVGQPPGENWWFNSGK